MVTSRSSPASLRIVTARRNAPARAPCPRCPPRRPGRDSSTDSGYAGRFRAASACDLGEDLLAKAETLLVTEADQLGPRELRTFGSRILEYLAPDIAEAADYQRLLDQERRAAAVTRLTLRRRGDGSTDLHARIPDLTASLLRTFLAAFTAPRRRHHHGQGETVETPFGPLTPPIEDEFANLPIARQQGIGFVALLERVLKSDLPRHGGKATSLVVLIDHDTLLADLTAAGIAQTSTGEKMTAGQARRLACQAGLRAAVLGTTSEVLDLGRESRSSTPPNASPWRSATRPAPQVDCTMPAAYCEAHHPQPWSEGGHTNLDDGQAPLPLPPPPRPRPRLDHPPPPQRIHHLHPTPIAGCERRLSTHPVSRQALRALLNQPSMATSAARPPQPPAEPSSTSEARGVRLGVEAARREIGMTEPVVDGTRFVESPDGTTIAVQVPGRGDRWCWCTGPRRSTPPGAWSGRCSTSA